MLSAYLPNHTQLRFQPDCDGLNLGILQFPLHASPPFSALSGDQASFAPTPMSMKARDVGDGASNADARTQMHQPISTCTTPVARLFVRSEVVERLGCNVVATRDISLENLQSPH